MNEHEFTQALDTWCADVRAEALRIFADGALEAECIGLAINVVESRRKKLHVARQRFNPLPATIARN